MKTLFKIVGGLLLLLIAVTLAGAGYFFHAFPDAQTPPDVTVQATPERLARGKYIAHHVSLCVDCHSERDWTRFAGPIRTETLGGGGEVFDESMGLPGRLVSPNITPYALASWSDGEIIRAVTQGVSREGRALFPLMPYPAYAQMKDEDLQSVIAYIRTLSPVSRENEERRLHFPVNLLVRTMPRTSFPRDPALDDGTLGKGAYLTILAACAECHTPAVAGEPVEGFAFAGGMRFQFPDGSEVYSANITPDPQYGIGNWSREDFVSRFKMYESEAASTLSPEDMGFNTPMPWLQYAGMTEEDLGLIYDYLRTVPAAAHNSDEGLPVH